MTMGLDHELVDASDETKCNIMLTLSIACTQATAWPPLQGVFLWI